LPLVPGRAPDEDIKDGVREAVPEPNKTPPMNPHRKSNRRSRWLAVFRPQPGLPARPPPALRRPRKVRRTW